MQQRLQHPRHTGQVRLVRTVSFSVPGGELRDLGVPLGRVIRQPQVPSVLPRREVGTLRVDLVAVLLQAQVAHQVRRQQGNHVGQRRHRVVRAERMLADRRPARHIAPLADHRLQAGPRQVRRRDQAVVPAADHYRVRACRHRDPFPRNLLPQTVRDLGPPARAPRYFSGTVSSRAGYLPGTCSGGPAALMIGAPSGHRHRCRPAGCRHRRARHQRRGGRRRGGRGRRGRGPAGGAARAVRFRLRIRHPHPAGPGRSPGPGHARRGQPHPAGLARRGRKARARHRRRVLRAGRRRAAVQQRGRRGRHRHQGRSTARPTCGTPRSSSSRPATRRLRWWTPALAGSR